MPANSPYLNAPDRSLAEVRAELEDRWHDLKQRQYGHLVGAEKCRQELATIEARLELIDAAAP